MARPGHGLRGTGTLAGGVRSEVRSQRSEVRGQKSEVRDQRLKTTRQFDGSWRLASYLASYLDIPRPKGERGLLGVAFDPDFVTISGISLRVPEGHPENSPAFQRREHDPKDWSPEGTAETPKPVSFCSVVPSGLCSSLPLPQCSFVLKTSM